MTDEENGDVPADPRAAEDLAADAERAAAASRAQRLEGVLRRGDDVEIAHLITKELTTSTPWVHSAESFWKYMPLTGAWAAQDAEEIRVLAMAYAGFPVVHKIVGDNVETRALKMNNGRVEGIVRCVETLMHHREFFDDAPAGIAFKNGFVAVTPAGEVEIRKHDPDHKARFVLDYSYNDHGCEAWRDFLREVFLGDVDMLEKIECLRQFVGLCLIGRIVGFEKALILYGAGSNGKSVLLSTVLDIFPMRARSSVAPQMWAEEYHLARLDGSAINVVSELPQREILESGSMKEVISGDMVTARRPRENPFDFRPRAGHIFSSNPPMPQVGDFSPGFWRRWTMIEFRRRFEGDQAEAKEKLLARLRAEIPGIVFWCIEGAARAIRVGKMQDVPSSSTALERWRKASDQIATFVEEECTRTEASDQYSIDEIYRGYRSWCGRSGHKTVGRTRFRERVEAVGVGLSQDASARWFAQIKCRTMPRDDEN